MNTGRASGTFRTRLWQREGEKGRVVAETASCAELLLRVRWVSGARGAFRDATPQLSFLR